MAIKGIDVSRWQGTIDWIKVRSSGIEFAILKAGGSDKGFYADPTFEQNYAGAKKANIPVGVYYFVGPGFVGKDNGVADAKRFAEIIKGKQFEYPVFLDLESTPTTKKVEVTDASIAFCNYLESLGYYVGIYASDISGFHNRLDISKLSAFDKWVARYGSNPAYVKQYGIWQYSSTGKVNGINGNVDMDISYKDYPSIITMAGLNGFAKKEVEKPVGEVSDKAKLYTIQCGPMTLGDKNSVSKLCSELQLAYNVVEIEQE